MGLETLTGPAAEPLTLAEAKAHLRVDHDDEDAVITALIAAARARVEAYGGLRLITQTVRLTLDAFPVGGRPIWLPVWPVQSVDSVGYTESDGTAATLAPARWQLVRSGKPARLAPAYLEVWPIARLWYDSVTVEMTAGFGDAAADLPADLVSAVKLVLGTLYEHREDVLAGATVGALPLTAETLIGPHVFHPGPG